MAGKTQIGTRAITKKMFGTREITKEVVNGVVVYEKQAPVSNVTLTLSITGSANYDKCPNNLWFKIGETPTTSNDWDYAITGIWFDPQGEIYISNKSGHLVDNIRSSYSYDISIPQGTTLYFWGNGNSTITGYTISTNYSSPNSLVVNSNTTLNIQAYYDDD